MTREEARLKIRSEWRTILSQNLPDAERKVNHETSYICPLCGHGSNGDGLTYNPRGKEGALKCFGCGFSGDVLDLYQQWQGMDYNTALKTLADEIEITVDPYRPTAAEDFKDLATAAQRGPQGRTEATRSAEGINTQPDGKQPQNGPTEATGGPDYTEYYKACLARLNDPTAAAYLKQRGISLETAKAYWIGFDPQADPANAPGAMGTTPRRYPTPRIIIPCSKGHYIGRSISPQTADHLKKMNNAGGKATEFFNGAALYDGSPEVFITEGAFDALSIMETGGTAIAVDSVNNAKALLEQIKARPTEAALILCLDSDQPGQRATDQLAEGLKAMGLPFIDASASVNGSHKDPNEAFTADREGFIKAVREARSIAEQARAEQQERAVKEAEERRERTGPEMIDSFLAEITSRRYEPTPTGIADIDRAIGGGFIRQQLVLLGAAPGAGKTALTQWIFEGMAQKGTPVIYLNLEMSREQMLARSISRIAGRKGKQISPAEVLQGYKWTPEQRETVRQAADDYKADIAPRMLYNPDGVTADLDSILKYIEAEAERAQKEGQAAVPFVVLDYLQIVSGGPHEDDTAVIKRAVQSLKEFAIRYNTVVYLIIAHNRQANMRGDVTMESGRDTSALEYSADLQLGLAYTFCLKRNGREGKSKDALTPEQRKYVTLKITKCRFGIPGTEVDLFFDGKTMSFDTNIAKAALDFADIADPPKDQPKAGRKL